MSAIPLPPDVIASAIVLEFAIVGEGMPYKNMGLYVGAEPLGAVPALAICQDPDGPGVLLFFCNEGWGAVCAADHPDLAAAKADAESMYAGITALWQSKTAPQSEAEKAAKLEAYWDGVKCSFCGARPDQVTKIVQGEDAYICDKCVKEFVEQVKE